jgi:uncharacterized integral membrane protein
MILLSRLVMLLAVVVLLLFCMSNLDSITVKMVGWESPQMPLFLILLFVFFFGFFLALFWQALRSVTRKKEARSVPAVVSEPKPEKQKKERRWGKKKENAREAATEPEEEAADASKGAVDKDDEKVNITDESADASPSNK